MYANLYHQLETCEQEKRPVRVAVAGFGFIGRGLVNQSTLMHGIQISLVYARDFNAVQSHAAASSVIYEYCRNAREVLMAYDKGRIPVVDHPGLLLESNADIVIDTTGSPEFGAWLCWQSLLAGKHVVATPEMDICIGPWLNQLARAKNLVYSGQDGDEPGVVMNLYHYVASLGFEITAMGKFKNFNDRYANPDSVLPWTFGQNPYKISSFADGSKMNIEMGTVCNATGFTPDVRGMHCQTASALEDVTRLMRPKEEGGLLSKKGVVDVVKGVKPYAGVFVVARTDNSQIRSDMTYYKMGEGPYYLFYRPYHLASVEILIGAANACLNHVSTIQPVSDRPVADVAVFAKKDLAKGDKLDCIGGFCYYGLMDNFETLQGEQYLPVSMAEDAVLLQDVKKDEMITLDKVMIRGDSVLWKLRSDMLEKRCRYESVSA